MELAGPDHDQLEQDKDRAQHLTVVQLYVITQLLTQQKLESTEKT